MAEMATQHVSSAEVHFAQRLAANEKKTRDKAVKRLRKWLEIKSLSTKGSLTHDDFLKVWKGLHYCMWMSDKPIVQEELASSISSLVHILSANPQQAFLFMETFFQTEAREWHGIDRWRIDKFMMLVRQCLHQCLVFVRNAGWQETHITQFTDILSRRLVDATGQNNVPDGLKYHVIDLYLSELTSVAANQISAEQVDELLKPFTICLPSIKSVTLVKYIISHVFDVLHDEQLQRLQQHDDDEHRETESNVQLKVDLVTIAELLFGLAGEKTCVARNRPIIYHLVTKLESLSKGILPAEELVDSGSDDSMDDGYLYSALKRLQNLDHRLMDQSGLGKKKQKKNDKMAAALQREKASKKRRYENIIDGDADMDEEECLNDDETDVDVKSVKKKKRSKTKKVKLEEKDVDSVGKSIDACPNTDNRGNTTISSEKFTKLKTSGTSWTNSNVESSTTMSKKWKRRQNNVSGDEDGTNQQSDETMSLLGQHSTWSTENSENGMIKKRKQKKRKKSIVCSPVMFDAVGSEEAVTNIKLVDSQIDNDRSQSSGTPSKSKKNKKKRHKEASSVKCDSGLDSSVDQEVEIWIPNKKYKYKQKLTSTPVKRRAGSEGEKVRGESVSSTGSPQSATPFARFEAVVTPFPAFVKRAALKKKTPKSEPTKTSRKPVTPDESAERRKQVSFNMKRNTSLDFNDSISFRPDLPYNPAKKPDQSILKSPVNQLQCQLKGKGTNSSKVKHKRLGAADFF